MTVEELDDRGKIAWLHRRAGFSLHPDQLQAATERGVAAEFERLVRPDNTGGATAAVDWDDARLSIDNGRRAAASTYAVRTWIERMAATERPLEDRMAWLLHGWVVSALDKVRLPLLMVNQIRLFVRSGLGPYPALLEAVTTDAAMLSYLDGRESTGDSPNENYARELVELFSLGPGNYTEADVQAGALALTGWTLRQGSASGEFRNSRHDDVPRHYLDTDGVHDVATVIAAVVDHPAHPAFVAKRIATEVLGAAHADVVDELAGVYTDRNLALRPVMRRALELGLAGKAEAILLAPVPWLAMALRVTGAKLAPRLLAPLRVAGQIPLVPPSVAGWPGGKSWLGAGSMVGRAQLAAAVAGATGQNQPVARASADGDFDTLADALGLPVPSFGPATTAALDATSDPTERLTLALLSPEFLVS